MKTKLQFKLSKEHYREMEFETPDKRKVPIKIIHACPTLEHWQGKQLPDEINPRSHNEECLATPVAKAIERTLVENPEFFQFANRGSTIIAEECEYSPKEQLCTIWIKDPTKQGLADGATTDAVIGRVQEKYNGEDASFKDARINLKIITGIKDHDMISALVSGQNTSRQVKSWSMTNFEGHFDWIKEIIEESDLRGKVGYEENAGQDVTILDVISILTLFHPEFNERGPDGAKAPVTAYSNKGKMSARLQDETLLKGYESLKPILLDILKLHDYIYINFEAAYTKAFGAKSKLGKREGIESRLGKTPYKLPLTQWESNYTIPSGYIFPLLAAFRALIRFGDNGASWVRSPFAFFEAHGAELIHVLIDQIEVLGSNPNKVGRTKTVYTALFSEVKLLMEK